MHNMSNDIALKPFSNLSEKMGLESFIVYIPETNFKNLAASSHE